MKCIQHYSFKRRDDQYLKEKEYLLEINLVAECDCLLGRRVGMFPHVLDLNNKQFEHKYIYNLGIYNDYE